MSNYGHWSVFEDVDINQYLGFVYVITFDDGKKYVGAKKIWKRIKVAPCEFKRGPKKGFEQSDWATYTSSSNELNSLLEKGIKPKEYLIVGWYPTWGKTLMAEMEMQLANDVLRDPMWLNKQIGGHFNPNCFDDLTQHDISRWMEFDKGNEHVTWPMMYKVGQKTKYVHPDNVAEYLNSGWQYGRSKTEKHGIITICSSYKLWDYVENKEVQVDNQTHFASLNNISASHLTRLLQGDLDLIQERWGLHPTITRQRYKFKEIGGNETLFLTNADVEAYFGGSRGSCGKIVKEGKVEKLAVESKKDHVLKLSKLQLVTTIRQYNESQMKLNSFKDATHNLSIDEKQSTIEWIENYLEYLKNN